MTSYLDMVPLPKIGRSSTLPQVAVCTSAFGSTLMLAQGQAASLKWIHEAGADKVEIRRELLPTDFQAFDMLGTQCVEHSLGVIYSTADGLWDETRPAESVSRRLQEARELGAESIKFALGDYRGAGRDTWQALSVLFTDSGIPQILIENDQTSQGGSISAMTACLKDAEHAGCSLGMTFDIGNWQWCGASAQHAAECLGRHVRYVHCKGVRTDISGKCHARVPSDKDLYEWSSMFRHFPKDVIRAIEYPLQPTPPLAQDDMRHADLGHPSSDLPRITRREVERLRAITTPR